MELKSRKIPLKFLWPVAMAVLLACLILVFSPGWSTTDRLTNLDLENDSISDTYIMFSKSRSDRCLVLNRRDATIHRSDNNLTGKNWRYLRFGGDGATGDLDCWLVRSKSKGTLFFIPVEQVEDWIYPYFYRHIRKTSEDSRLPPVSWTQLYVNRIFAGLYLRMKLPFDKRKRDGGSGILREVLSVDGDTLTRVDTRVNEDSMLYAGMVADGHFPELTPPPERLAWLASHCPTEETTLLLGNTPPFNVSLLPLPVSLPSLLVEIPGQKMAPFVDERYMRWTHGGWRKPEPLSRLLDQTELDTLRTEFRTFAGDFRKALNTHGVYHDKAEVMRTLLADRGRSAIDPGFDLGRE